MRRAAGRVARAAREPVSLRTTLLLMMLAAGPGSKLSVHAEGADAARAVSELESLLNRHFDED